jgi:hypothetical protein
MGDNGQRLILLALCCGFGGLCISISVGGRMKMKRLAIGIVASLALLSVSVGAQNAQSFNGEIIDSDCAATGVHPSGETAKQCTVDCVKAGAKYVLYDAGTKTVYQLDDQMKPEKFAGEKVKVSGTLDAATKTIHVTAIQAAA